MQLLILAHALDSGAEAVAMALSPLLDYRLTVLRPEWLGQANWLQRTDDAGRTLVQLSWRNGHRLDSAQVGLLWNRARALPRDASRLGGFGDRSHAGAELQSLVDSWLAGMDDRVEPSLRRHGSLATLAQGPNWQAAAARCGLAVAPGVPAQGFTVLRTPLELTSRDGLALPPALAQACDELAEDLGLSLLSLTFRGNPQAPQLCRVDAHPALDQPGEVQAVARWLAERYEASLESQALAATVP